MHQAHEHHHDHSHSHDDNIQTLTHTHDGHTHTHALPDDTRITWRSLLALGISGGLLPCPSALVVMLSAITMNRIGYGLLLVVAFSIGLAATLTGIGLLFLYAGRFLKRASGIRESRLVKLLPVLSALVITLVGVAICYQALVTNGFKL
jgi:ABC-type nickel/cobalt efflux system permease component RcnA